MHFEPLQLGTCPIEPALLWHRVGALEFLIPGDMFADVALQLCR